MLPDYLEHFPQLCVKFEPWRKQLGTMFMTSPYFKKRGILNVPFCAIFVPFHFYLVMTLVVPCLDNMFMVLLISELAKIGATKPIYLDSGSP